MSLGNSSLPQQVALPLDGAKDAQLVATCCGTTYYPRTRNVSASVQLVLKTTLLTSWVVVPGQQVRRLQASRHSWQHLAMRRTLRRAELLLR